MATDPEQKKLQSPARLNQSASLANMVAEPTARVPAAKVSLSPKDATASVEPGIRISFFFDGTGNNLTADVGNNEHSNVARLFLAHDLNDSSRYSYYIPGIGTRFKDIGDPGGTTRGLAFADRGDDRLDWAMSRLEERLARSGGQKLHVAVDVVPV